MQNLRLMVSAFDFLQLFKGGKIKMLKYLFKRLNQDEQGFTLVELLVVIVILGVLMGIGIPTYRGFVKRSHEAATIAELTAVSNAMNVISQIRIAFFPTVL